jgi:hypothetical protein
MFCDLNSEYLEVMDKSPCLPENSEGCGQIGVYGRGCIGVSIESTSWGHIKALYK